MPEIVRQKRQQEQVVNRQFATRDGDLVYRAVTELVDLPDDVAARIPGSADRPVDDIAADMERLQEKIAALEATADERLADLAEAVQKGAPTAKLRAAAAEAKIEADAAKMALVGLRLDLQEAQHRERWQQYQTLVSEEAQQLQTALNAHQTLIEAQARYREALAAVMRTTQQRAGMESHLEKDGKARDVENERTAARLKELHRAITAIEQGNAVPGVALTPDDLTPALLHRTKDGRGQPTWTR